MTISSLHPRLALVFLFAIAPSIFGQQAPAADSPAVAPERDSARPPDAPKDDDRTKLRDIGQLPADAEPAPEPPLESQSGDSRGDLPLGGHTVPAGRTVRDAISLLGPTTVNGVVASDAVSIGGSTQISSGARVGGAAVAVFGRVESQGEIGDEAVSVFGGAMINGPVGGDVVSVFGSLELGPKAVVGGDVVVIGGRLIRDPNAIVRGDEVHLSALPGVPNVDWFTTWVTRCGFMGRPLAFGANLGWAWAVAFSFLAFYLFLALILPRGVVRCAETLETRPGYTIVASLLTVFLTPVAVVLLAVTVVGALLIPFLGAGLIMAKLFGKAVMLAWIGRRLTRFFGDGPLGHPVFAVLFGGLIVLMIYTVPIVGFLAYKVLSWIGLGVVVYTIALAMNRERQPALVAAGGIAPPAPPLPATYPPEAPAPSSPAMSMPPAAASGIAAPMMSAGFSDTSLRSADAPRAPEPVPAPEPQPPVMEAPGPVAPPPLVPPLPPTTAAYVPPESAAHPLPPPPVAAPRTPQPPPPVAPAIAWPRAGFAIRIGALAIDGVLIGLILALVSGLLPDMLEFDQGPGGWLLALAIYGALMWKHKGTTIGGIVCGLKVVRVDNRELDWATAIVRALACFLSLAVVGLGFIWIAIDDENQSWHDKIAGTAVVVLPKGMSLV